MVPKRAKIFKILCLLFSIAIIVYVLSKGRNSIISRLLQTSDDPTLPSKELMTSANTTRNRQTILLLVYNEFFGYKEWISVDEDCSVPRTRTKPCKKEMFEVTYDKRRFYESDFVLVHVASNLPSLRHLKSLRKLKPSSQLWIYYSMESPLSSRDARLFDGMFDLTFTYRLDSDFWVPYGTYEEIPFVDLSQQDFSSGKDELVAWIVSNCKPQLRKSFVHELQKYITVDVFGSCSRQFGKSKSCARGETCRGIIKQYKFFLAFENGLCEDYITEKYWRHLGEENVVPVVMGGANYTKLAIPGSYINVLDFKTVKNLSDYLHYLDKNNTAYNEYFKWRQNYRPIFLRDFCSFCEVLTSESPKGIKNLTDFWVTQGRCSEKDLLMLNMWTRTSKLPAYFSILVTFILIMFMLITLAVYFTQVYKVHHQELN